MDLEGVLHPAMLEFGGVPSVVIINHGNYTTLYVDGKVVNGCTKLSYMHEAESAPVLETECAPQ